MTASGWNWVGLAAVVFLAACGGRTSTLTDDNDPSLGSSVPGSAGAAAGSSNVAGSPSTSPGPGVMTGTGGSSSSPAGPGTGIAGSTASSGAPSSDGTPVITPACTAFCNSLKNNPCVGELGITTGTCPSDCTGALGVDQCAPLARALLDCYTPIFAASAGHCTSLDNQLERRCSRHVLAYQDCAQGAVPEPPPSPACSSSGSGSLTQCEVTNTCSDGVYYAVNCKNIAPDSAECTCISATGMNAQFTLNEGANRACFDAAVSCGLPNVPPEFDPGPLPK